MAKPKFSIIVDSFEELQKLAGMLGGGSVVAAPPLVVAPPVVQPPVVTAPPVVVAPSVVVAPPLVVAPPVVQQPVVQAGGKTMEECIAVMSTKVASAGGAQQVGEIMKRYNAKAPGQPGPITNVDPAQFTNLWNELSALP